jgi:hypothetical protein
MRRIRRVRRRPVTQSCKRHSRVRVLPGLSCAGPGIARGAPSRRRSRHRLSASGCGPASSSRVSRGTVRTRRGPANDSSSARRRSYTSKRVNVGTGERVVTTGRLRARKTTNQMPMRECMAPPAREHRASKYRCGPIRWSSSRRAEKWLLTETRSMTSEREIPVAQTDGAPAYRYGYEFASGGYTEWTAGRMPDVGGRASTREHGSDSAPRSATRGIRPETCVARHDLTRRGESTTFAGATGRYCVCGTTASPCPSALRPVGHYGHRLRPPGANGCPCRPPNASPARHARRHIACTAEGQPAPRRGVEKGSQHATNGDRRTHAGRWNHDARRVFTHGVALHPNQLAGGGQMSGRRCEHPADVRPHDAAEPAGNRRLHAASGAGPEHHGLGVGGEHPADVRQLQCAERGVAGSGHRVPGRQRLWNARRRYGDDAFDLLTRYRSRLRASPASALVKRGDTWPSAHGQPPHASHW